jgi:hypothetical protein
MVDVVALERRVQQLERDLEIERQRARAMRRAMYLERRRLSLDPWFPLLWWCWSEGGRRG